MSTETSKEVDQASTTPRRWKYLMPRRGSSYKQLFVMGRIFTSTLHTAFTDEEEPMTVEEIAADWDIPREAVQEAIEYFESNPPEMLDDWRRDEALAEASGMNDPNYKLNPTPKLVSPQEIARILSE
jgi:hypothetical protein